MTEHLKITAKIPRKRYVADGAQTVFSFDFVLFQPNELLVTVNGVPVTSGVAVSLLADGTGTAAFAAAPAANAVVVLLRRVTIKRETDFQEGGELRAKTLNDEFDFQTAALQQVETAAARALQLPIDDADNAATVLPVASARAAKMLAFDASGNPTLSNQTLAQIEAGSSAAAGSADAAAASATASAASAAAAQNAATAAGAQAGNAASAASAAAASAASIALPLPLASGGTGATTTAAARTNLGLGTAATLNAGNAANELPKLDSLGRLPAVDGSQLTNLAGAATQIAAGEALLVRDLIYQDIFNQRGGGADRWYKVDADAVSPVRIGPRIGIASAAIASSASGTAQVRPGRVAGFSGLTAGQPVFASATAGAVTQTAPAIPASGTQNATRRVGYAASATEIDFDPEDDTIFTARNSAVAVDGTITVQHWTDSGAREREQAAYLVQATSFVTTASRPTGTGSNGTGWTGYGVRARVEAAQVSVSGGSVRVTLAAQSGGTTFSNVFIGHGVTAGNLWEFAAAPTRVTFASANSVAVGGNASAVSDSITFALDETRPLIVAMDIGSGSTWNLAVGSAPTGWNGWTKAGGAGEAGTTAPTGYTNDWLVGLASVEVLASARDEPLTIGGSLANSTATDRVNVRYDDGSGANADTRTTFINRTGAARDLACEVML